jgi:8-oxo-dGTP pyrophosphatase MutT (NUDIX family)
MSPEPRPGDPDPIRRIRERAVYGNSFITVYDDPVTFGDGGEGSYVRIVESRGRSGVAMLPLAAGRVGLVRTYRYPIGAWEWGIPRGFAHGQDARESARAELAEEIGGAPAELAELGTMTPNSGLLASVVHMFVARYPAPVSAGTDQSEVAEVRWLTIPALLSDIAAGRITDGFTLAAVCSATCRGML